MIAKYQADSTRTKRMYRFASSGEMDHQFLRSAGPFDLETMFEACNSLIEDKARAADSLSRAVAPPTVRTLEDLKPNRCRSDRRYLRIPAASWALPAVAPSLPVCLERR